MDDERKTPLSPTLSNKAVNFSGAVSMYLYRFIPLLLWVAMASKCQEQCKQSTFVLIGEKCYCGDVGKAMMQCGKSHNTQFPFIPAQSSQCGSLFNSTPAFKACTLRNIRIQYTRELDTEVIAKCDALVSKAKNSEEALKMFTSGVVKYWELEIATLIGVVLMLC